MQWPWLARDMFHFAAEAQAMSCQRREDLHEEMTKRLRSKLSKKEKQNTAGYPALANWETIPFGC